ncbi:hypothetical protein IFM5058_10991 [Aspergillus udagawae]|nr:hypothetical protein IFM5058_10991 [Aspergillus udagawae]
MDYYAEPIRSTRKVSIVLDTPDDWRNWDAHIRGLAMTYGILDILLQKTPRPAKPIHPDDLEFELTNQNAAPSNQTTVARSESSNDRDEQDTREQASQPAERDARPPQASQSVAAALDPRTLYER